MHYLEGPNVYVTWNRMYDSNVGRWLSRDPIGVAGGVNLYGYVGGDVLGETDSLGLYIDSARAACMTDPSLCFELFGTYARSRAAIARRQCDTQLADYLEAAAGLSDSLEKPALAATAVIATAAIARAGVSYLSRKGAKGASTRNPEAYEVFFEATVSGSSRSAHRASANKVLAGSLERNADLASSFNSQFGVDVLGHMRSGKGLLNPPGTVWHHPADNPSVMQLLMKATHTNPLLQSILHPGGIGGFGAFYGR